MTGRSHIVALATVLALTGASLIVAAQQRPNRVSDREVRELLNRIDAGIAVFGTNVNRAIDRSRTNVSRADDDINQSVNDFKQATARLRDRLQNRRAAASDVEDVLRHASLIDDFMMRHEFDDAVERNWHNLRGDLDELARAYGVTWNWTGSLNVWSRLSDQQVERISDRSRSAPSPSR